MHRLTNLHCLIAALAFTACAPSGLPPAEGLHRSAVHSLEQAASPKATPEQRAALYLDAAREASALLDSPSSGASARQIYNKAAADLTVLLRAENNGALWNRPLTLQSGGNSYRLRFAQGTRDGVWGPDYFTSFTPAGEVDLKTIDRRNRQDGIGGALVGVHKNDPLEVFSPLVGITAPVTAVLDFKGRDVTLSLIDPTKKTQSPVAGKAADWTPIFPLRSPTIRRSRKWWKA